MIESENYYGKNFTIRFTDEQKRKLDRYSKLLKVRPTTLIRRALSLFYESHIADEEVTLVRNTHSTNLFQLITKLKTEKGRKELQKRIEEAL